MGQRRVVRGEDQAPGDKVVDRRGKELDYTQLTLYDVMRMENYKASRFLKEETYPNIRPPISKCSHEKSGELLSEAFVKLGSKKPFGKDKRHDIMEIWRQTPNKDSLSFYGMGSRTDRPEAVKYRKALSNSLDIVNGVERKSKKSKQKPTKVVKPPKPKGAYVLNRNTLHCAISQMPRILQKTRAQNANRILHCPEDQQDDDEFGDSDIYFPLQVAFDMYKPPKPPKHGLRRHHMYCDLKCGIPENMCTYYQWLKYKEGTLPDNVQFALELEKELERELCINNNFEPKTFDDLYSNLVSCFEKNTYQISPCTIYGKCCRRPAERHVIQGCGEDKIFGPQGKL